MSTPKTAIRKRTVADFDLYKTTQPITRYKSTCVSHFKQSRPLNLFVKDMVERMSVYLNLISYCGGQMWESELEEQIEDVNLY